MQDFRYVGLDIFYASSEHSEIFISVFYPNWLIIRKFYLNLHGIGGLLPSIVKKDSEDFKKTSVYFNNI